MYISRVTNLPKSVVYDIKGNGYKNHLFIMSKLFGKYSREEAGVLFRVDELEDGRICFIIKSNVKPESDECVIESKKIDNICIKEGQRFCFWVRVNAVKKNKDNKYVVVKSVEDQTEWFAGKEEQLGAKLELVSVDKEECVTGKNGVKLNTSLVKGVLEIVNVDTFKEVMMNGFGREKCCGFGMMSIGRA